MRVIVERLIKYTETVVIEPLLKVIHDLKYDIAAIDEGIASLKDEIGFWTRVNPFNHTEEKYQLKDLNRERAFYVSEYTKVSKELKEYLYECLKKDNALNMKSLAGAMSETLYNLKRKAKQRGVQSAGMGSVPQFGYLEAQIAQLNQLLNQEYGFDPKMLDSRIIIDTTFDFLVKSN